MPVIRGSSNPHRRTGDPGREALPAGAVPEGRGSGSLRTRSDPPPYRARIATDASSRPRDRVAGAGPTGALRRRRIGAGGPEHSRAGRPVGPEAGAGGCGRGDLFQPRGFRPARHLRLGAHRMSGQVGSARPGGWCARPAPSRRSGGSTNSVGSPVIASRAMHGRRTLPPIRRRERRCAGPPRRAARGSGWRSPRRCARGGVPRAPHGTRSTPGRCRNSRGRSR